MSRSPIPALFRGGLSGRWTGYGCALGAVLAATGIRMLLGLPPDDYPFLSFFPAVIVTAMLFGGGPGCFAAVLSAGVTAYAFISPVGSFAIGWPSAGPVAVFLIATCGISILAQALHNALRRTHAAESHNAVLLDEISHRAKNDLAIIIAAVRMQVRAADEPAVRAALEQALGRIEAVAGSQRRLMAAHESGMIEVQPYLEGLCDDLTIMVRNARPVIIHPDADRCVIARTDALTLGLIVNELVTNALKYAFPDNRPGEIVVRLVREGESALLLSVSDDGVGLSSSATDGLGSRLVTLLARGASLVRSTARGGCQAEILLPIPTQALR